MKQKTKRRSLLALISLLMVACMTLLAFPVSATGTGDEEWDVWDGTLDRNVGGGSGTPTDPYLITSAEQLAGLAANVIDKTPNNLTDTSAETGGWGNRTWGEYTGIRMSKYYKLTVNVDLDGREWIPIGVQNRIFEGVFDGDGHTVKNFKITKSEFTEADVATYGLCYVESNGTPTYLTIAGRAGLFGDMGAAGATEYNVATVKNLTVTNANIKGTQCGGIIGFVNGKKVLIDNCHVSDITLDATVNAGGILGYTNASAGKTITVTNCSASDMTVGASATKFGGIVGMAYQTVLTISNCDVVLGSMNSNNIKIMGGVFGGTAMVNSVATVAELTVENCSVTADTDESKIELANAQYVGGIIGDLTGTTKATIRGCYSDVDFANINKVVSAGGVVGYAYNVALLTENCIAEGDISAAAHTYTGEYQIGGIVGVSNGSTTGVTSTDEKNIGRLIKNCIYTGDISINTSSTALACVGGIAGKFMNAVEIADSKMYGTVSLTLPQATTAFRAGIFVGGFGYGGTAYVAIHNSICVVPENTVVGDVDNDTAQTSGTHADGSVILDAVGANNNSWDASVAGLALAPSTSDIDMSLEGVQWATPAGFDHDNDTTTPEVTANDVRFVATLGDSESDDDADILSQYSAVGFVITAVYGTEVHDYSKDVKHVYTSIKAAGEDVTAESLGGDYIVAITGEKIPAAATDTVTFYVTPKLVSADGNTTTYGATATLVFVGGVYQTPAQPAA